MGRRSPVLGYNHNVRYRGLVFHVQTEDSGIVNPHLFTHLFHGGVIVSTRKLVYDPDADDGVVKSLMQAQHKAVMKELRRGLFDDKIDINLRGTPGLLPRGSDDGAVEETGAGQTPVPEASAADLRALDAIVDPGSSPVVQIVPELLSGPTAQALDLEAEEPSIELTPDEEPSAPEIVVERHPHMTPPGVPILVAPDRTIPSAPPQMDLRRRPEEAVPPLPPPPVEAAPLASRTATPGTGPRRASTPPPMSSASLPPIPHRATPGSRTATPVPRQQQSMTPPVVVTRPITRDTPPAAGGPRSEVSQAFEQIAPGQEEIEIHSPAPGSAPPPPGAAAQERASEYIHRRGERGMRDEVRTGRIPQERQSVQRPAVPEPRGSGKKSGSQPTIPPEPRAEKSGSGSRPAIQPPEERPARAAPGVTEPRFGARPGTAGESPRVHPRAATPPPIPEAARHHGPSPFRTSTPSEPPRTAPPPAAAEPPRAASQAEPPPRAAPPSTRGTPPENAVPAVTRARTPTAPRPFAAGGGAPRQATSTASPRARSGSGSGSGGVVMSRPAVIVGGRAANPPPAPAPAAHAAAPSPPDGPRTSTGTGARVRRAREDAGGRGVFGQDLISEKSLDEVILAYLSEDASEE